MILIPNEVRIALGPRFAEGAHQQTSVVVTFVLRGSRAVGKTRSLLNTISFGKHHRFSVLLTTPKPNLLRWLAAYQREKGLERYRLYYPEGNLAFVIPSLDEFSVIPGSFERFLERIKPRLLEAELSRFSATPEDLGRPITKETFDELYDLEVREFAHLMSDFADAEELCMISET